MSSRGDVESARSALYRHLLIAAVAALLLFALLSRLPAPALLAAVWGLLLTGAAFRSRRGLGSVEVRREVYPSAFENDEARVELVLQGGSRMRMLEIGDRFGPSLVAEQRLLEPGPLGPGLRRRLRYDCFCSRPWGRYALGPLQVVQADPAGLGFSSRTLPEVGEFAVFPRIGPVRELSRLGARATLAPTEASADRAGQSPVFLSVRDHRSGDDLRHVHWPATARRGSLVTKVYEVDLTPYTTIFLDLDRRHRAGTGRKSTLDYLVRTAASALGTALEEGGFAQLMAEGRRTMLVPPGRGEAHLAFALYTLLGAQQDGALPFHDAVALHLSRVPANSTAVLVGGTLFLDLGAWAGLLEEFRGRGVRPLFLLVNNHSFPPISGWPPPRAEVVERMRETVFFLRSRGARVQVLEEAEELLPALARGASP